MGSATMNSAGAKPDGSVLEAKQRPLVRVALEASARAVDQDVEAFTPSPAFSPLPPLRVRYDAPTVGDRLIPQCCCKHVPADLSPTAVQFGNRRGKQITRFLHQHRCSAATTMSAVSRTELRTHENCRAGSSVTSILQIDAEANPPTAGLKRWIPPRNRSTCLVAL